MTSTAAAPPRAIQSVLLSLDDLALDPAAEVPPAEPLPGFFDVTDEDGVDVADEEELADLASRLPPFSFASGSTLGAPASYLAFSNTMRGRTNP
jgi:hypothetical protein